MVLMCWQKKIARALSGEDLPLRFQVTGAGNLGFGQEVYPSQEFTEAKGGKVLAGKPCGDGKQAMMHSQKIGNAIRTIDTWHSKAESLWCYCCRTIRRGATTG